MLSAAAGSQPRALIVEPDRATREVAERLLLAEGVACRALSHERTAWEEMRRTRPHLVLASLSAANCNGLELMRRARGRSGAAFVLQAPIQGFGLAVRAIREGADDVLQVPYCREDFPHRALVAMKRATAREELEHMLAGSSRQIVAVREKARAVARFRVPLSIRGEPGTGRRRLAMAISHLDGVDLHCLEPTESIPSLSSLSGANVYLASVGEHSAAAQQFWGEVVLASVKGEQEGPNRIIVSSGADLQDMLESQPSLRGLARLVERYVLHLPPLRDRLTDMGELARAMTAEVIRDLGGNQEPVFSQAAMELLRRQPWPGNLEELRTLVSRLVVFSSSAVISKRCVQALLDEADEGVRAQRIILGRQLRDQLMREIEATGGNLAEVGRRLGMSRGAVIYRAQKFGLMPQRSKRPAARGRS